MLNRRRTLAIFRIPAKTYETAGRTHRKAVRDSLLTGQRVMDNDGFGPVPGEPIQIPIERELDLHTFNPRDLKELLPAYLAACREKGIYQVRVVHGKGIGNLRRTVHALLSRLPEVASYSLAGEA